MSLKSRATFNPIPTMKIPAMSYDGKPGAAKDVKETNMLSTEARESSKRQSGTPNYDRSKTKHKPFGGLGVRGHA